MADPATDTTYPAAIDALPAIGPLDRQNTPGIEHDEMHNRANAVLNALQALVGTEADSASAATIMGRLLRAESTGRAIVENVQTGTNYTLTAGDAFKMVCMSNSAVNSVVVPLNSVVPFQPGTRIDISWDGTGQTSVSKADPSITVNTTATLKLRSRHSKASLIKRASGPDVWDLVGELEAAP